MLAAKPTLIIGLVLSSLWLVPAPHAHACGGCVAPPGTFSAVDSHRMVIKLGLDESILWDQFIYSGAPEEFAWVLPVPSPETVVELADAAFIDIIDEETSPRILAPQCPGEAGGCGGWGSGGPDSFATNLADEVEVHSHEMVGPYETVVISADDPNALYAWLGANGYAFPDSGLPILDYYAEQKSSFVVLRLRPGVEVSAMQPVRVRFKGYMGQFPLRMIALGAIDAVDLSLWIIAPERYAPTNFPSRTVDPATVSWDWATNTSNYQEAFAQAIEASGGAAWITEYSQVFEGSELADRLEAEAGVDYALSLAGLHYPVLTRMRTRLPIESLTEDLALATSEDTGPVARDLVAGTSVGECPTPEAAGLAPAPTTRRAQLLFWILIAVGALWIRRRQRGQE